MRILTLDELPRSLDRQRAALQLGAFRRLHDRRSVPPYRRWRFRQSEYVGLFAVDGREVVGQVFVDRFPYRTASGLETVAGIAAVTTQLGARRRGVARALITEAHRREAEAGARFALLWTNLSWHAHDLYASLGYRDVYAASFAIRECGVGVRPPPHVTCRPATAGVLGRLEALYRSVVGGGYGFGPRPEGFLRAPFEAGILKAAELRVVRRRGRPVGYAVVGQAPYQVSSSELVALPGEFGSVLRVIESEAGTGSVFLSMTAVDRHAGELRRSGYLVRTGADWFGLMACPLRTSMSAASLRAELAVGRPTFSCMGTDRF